MTKANTDIKVNDMVMVIKGRPCCGFTGDKLGLTYVVTELKRIGGIQCKRCKKEINTTFVIGKNASTTRTILGYQISQVIKVNPPPVDETLDTTTKETSHERL